MQDCLFCNLPPERILSESNQFIVINDGFPVTEGHKLIIPKRHVETWFDLTTSEQTEANEVIRRVRKELLKNDSTITGFNIGMNCGETAGQTIFHCHIHLIPRRNGDTQSPKGGVRGVLPGKRSY